MIHNIAIVHYNTPALTAALVRSIRMHVPRRRIVVFDNSDVLQLPPMRDVIRIDNTRGQVVDFGEMIQRYPDRIPTACKWGSEKHIASVDWLFDYLPEGFLLLDSDVLLKKDITPLFDESVAWVGMRETQPYWFQAQRIAPYCLYINVPMCKAHGIRFWHEGQVYKLSHNGQPPFYDTGASFWEDCKAAGLPGREIDIYEYIEHFGGASCGDTAQQAWEWLDKHHDLYE